MALSGIEASRHKNDVWVKLSGYWEHNGAKCCQIFSVTKAGHCRRVRRGRRKEGKREREGKGGQRKGRIQDKEGRGGSGKEESVTSGTKEKSEERVTNIKGLRLLLVAKFTTLKENLMNSLVTP